MRSQREIYMHTHIYSSTIHNSREVEVTQMSTDRKMDKQAVGLCIQRVKYYPPLKRKKILTHATTWIDL